LSEQVTDFATIDSDRPLRVIQVGAGLMGQNWLDTITNSTDVELVGMVDLDLDVAAAAAASMGRPDLPLGRSLSELMAAKPDAVINVTVPAAHHAVSTEALFLGLPVLSEKPAAPTVAVALSLAAAAEVTGQLLMVSQSRRYLPGLEAFRKRANGIGPIGILACSFFRAPHFGGFREAMDFPLIIDMAIHPFDVARYVLGTEPVSVYCDSYNPAWSWYVGDAAAVAIFEFEGGTRFQYEGSWCSPGRETSWNGSWRASTARGSVLWDGDGMPAAEITVGESSAPTGLASAQKSPQPEQTAGALAEFVSALRTGITPSGEIHRNIGSLAMVEAAVASATSGAKVQIADVMEAAYAGAIAAEKRPDVLARLKSSSHE
jgi:predicted dehydrogenase